MEAILTRRSIRRFRDEEVPDEVVNQLLAAGFAAPSAGNQQPWHFVVIRERETLRRIPEVHPYSSMCPDAAGAILVCGDTTVKKHPHYWPQDCAAATENILIAARALGLGAVWLGIYPRTERGEGMRKMVGIPAGIEPFSLIPFGLPAEEKEPSERIEEERIHYDRWQDEEEA